MTVQRQAMRPVRVRTVRWLVVIGALILLELLVRIGVIDDRLVAPPTDIARSAVELAPTQQFLTDLVATATSVAVAFLVGAALGVGLGMLLWRVRVLGKALEPYLVTVYALPTMVFYPMLLAVMGLGRGPLVLVATGMVVVPVALGTMIALQSVNPTLFKVGRSLNCRRIDLFRKVIGPAATPLAIPGLKLGFIYAVIWVIAMEFIVATAGLGYRVGADYRNFDTDNMYAYILVIMVLSAAVNALLTGVERRVRRDMS